MQRKFLRQRCLSRGLYLQDKCSVFCEEQITIRLKVVDTFSLKPEFHTVNANKIPRNLYGKIRRLDRNRKFFFGNFSFSDYFHCSLRTETNVESCGGYRRKFNQRRTIIRRRFFSNV